MPMTVERMEAVEGLHKTIDRQDALIRQLGEALVVLDKIYIERVYLDALKAYNDWKARQP